MRVNRMQGLKTVFGFGPRIANSVEARPDGLLLHENFLLSMFPPHAGMRQYWRDFDALERWARSDPHREWWRQFLRDSGGTGFWHEAYFMRGGMEAVYDDMSRRLDFSRSPLRLPRAVRCSRLEAVPPDRDPRLPTRLSWSRTSIQETMRFSERRSDGRSSRREHEPG